MEPLETGVLQATRESKETLERMDKRCVVWSSDGAEWRCGMVVFCGVVMVWRSGVVW